MTGQQVVNNVKVILQDYNNVRWSETTMMDWINAGVKEIVNLSPRATTLVLDVPLIGGTKQSVVTLPGSRTGIAFVDAICSLGTSGNKPGNAISFIKRESLDAMIPNWHYDSTSQDTIYYVNDTMFPSTYFVYPPRPTSSPGYARIIVVVRPDPVTDLYHELPIGDQYSNSITDYVLFRCFSENMAVPNATERVQAHVAAFTASLKGADTSGIFVATTTAAADTSTTSTTTAA